MAAMVAGALTPPPRAALPVALAVSLAVHAAALEWWAPAVWWTSSPSTVSLPELRATLVEIAVVAPSPAMAETALPATPPSGVAPAPSNVVRLPTHPVVVPSPRVPSVAAAPPPAAVIAAAPHAPERPALPESPPASAVPATSSAATGGAEYATPADGAVGVAGTATANDTTPIAYRDNPSPPYPDSARRDGQQGLTVLEVLVSREGLPIEVAIVATSGFSELDAAAASGIRHWRFVPATRDHEPIDARIRVPVRFRLTADGR